MAEAIPRANWSEAEEFQSRWFYWEYLVNHWLVPGPAVLKQPEDVKPEGLPRSPNLEDYGWLLEPDSLVEQ